MNDLSTTLLFDTSIASKNIGDEIIVEAIKKEINDILPSSHIINAPTHEIIGRGTYENVKNCDYIFLAGTNALSEKYTLRERAQWKIGFRDTKYINDIILMGCGWANYENDNFVRKVMQKFLYKKLFASKYYHSVRDEYSKEKLLKMGFKVINTGCPTMWRLTPNHCNSIPKSKSKKVITTITCYRSSLEQLQIYKNMFEILLRNYEEVYLWLQQGINDKETFDILDFKNKDKIKFVKPSLKAYDKILKLGDIDYVGVRLHGGVRALQNKIRTIIISVDNRATEISKDTKLLVIEGKNILNNLENTINTSFKTEININFDNIEKWKSQFK
jgi:polysaccharide pyruvyl transferase WcaK-like protein